jgi:hypothetical protein
MFIVNKLRVLKAETPLHISTTVSFQGANPRPRMGSKDPAGN